MGTCDHSVVLIDDHRVFREALKSFLETTEFTSLGEIDAGDGAAQTVSSLNPQVAIVDVRTKRGEAWEVIAAIRRECPETTVVVLTAYDTDAIRTRATDAGAAYLPKGADGAEVLTCLRSVPRPTSRIPSNPRHAA